MLCLCENRVLKQKAFCYCASTYSNRRQVVHFVLLSFIIHYRSSIVASPWTDTLLLNNCDQMNEIKYILLLYKLSWVNEAQGRIYRKSYFEKNQDVDSLNLFLKKVNFVQIRCDENDGNLDALNNNKIDAIVNRLPPLAYVGPCLINSTRAQREWSCLKSVDSRIVQ
uniref:Uncharacterized protein n=1 Tax=Romanomermis culicivorax TaxID=13658 RepID=A0A915JZL4_ROMCU